MSKQKSVPSLTCSPHDVCAQNDALLVDKEPEFMVLFPALTPSLGLFQPSHLAPHSAYSQLHVQWHLLNLTVYGL